MQQIDGLDPAYKVIKSHNNGICGTRRCRIASYPIGVPILQTTDCGITLSTVVLLVSDWTNVIKSDDTSKSGLLFKLILILLILLAMGFPLHLTINATSTFTMLRKMGETVINRDHVIILRLRRGVAPRRQTFTNDRVVVSGKTTACDHLSPMFTKLRWIFCCISSSFLLLPLCLPTNVSWFPSPDAFLLVWSAANCSRKENAIITSEHESWLLIVHSEQAVVISTRSGIWVLYIFVYLRHQPWLWASWILNVPGNFISDAAFYQANHGVIKFISILHFFLFLLR